MPIIKFIKIADNMSFLGLNKQKIGDKRAGNYSVRNL